MADLLSDREQTVKDAQFARKPELLRFHVYECRFPRRPADPRWCVAAVHNGRVGFRQCGRKPTLEYAGHGWCSQHYPPNVENKRLERNARWAAEREDLNAKWEREAFQKKQAAAALDAIRKIAAGHNDPRALALEVLATPRRA